MPSEHIPVWLWACFYYLYTIYLQYILYNNIIYYIIINNINNINSNIIISSPVKEEYIINNVGNWVNNDSFLSYFVIIYIVFGNNNKIAVSDNS